MPIKLTPDNWNLIVNALRTKNRSASVGGDQRWQAHLGHIVAAILNNEQASLNEHDWVEIFYALAYFRSAGSDEILSAIGPGGQNAVAAGVETTQQSATPTPYAIVIVVGGMVQDVLSNVQALAHDTWDWDDFRDMEEEEKRELVQSYAPVWDTLKVIAPGLVRDAEKYLSPSPLEQVRATPSTPNPTEPEMAECWGLA